MSVRIDGIPDLVSRISRYGDRTAMADAAERGCEVVKEVLQNEFLSGQSVQERSGFLKGSWTIWKFETPVPGANLFTSVYYARFLNYGTAKVQARGFLEKALQAARPRIKPAVLETWRSGVAG